MQAVLLFFFAESAAVAPSIISSTDRSDPFIMATISAVGNLFLLYFIAQHSVFRMSIPTVDSSWTSRRVVYRDFFICCEGDSLLEIPNFHVKPLFSRRMVRVGQGGSSLSTIQHIPAVEKAYLHSNGC
jgi:hypothetical protein